MMAIVKEEDGFTLLELLLVIGVGAVLLLSGIGIYGLSTQAHKINQTKQTVASLKQQVKTFFYGQTSYGNNVDLTQILLNANLFPTTNLDANGRPVTVWDTPIEVIGKGNSFYIKLLDLDETPCTYLLPLDFANDSDFVMAGEAGGVGDVADLSVVGTVGVVPSPLDADVACDLAGNNIGFQFE